MTRSTRHTPKRKGCKSTKTPRAHPDPLLPRPPSRFFRPTRLILPSQTVPHDLCRSQEPAKPSLHSPRTLCRPPQIHTCYPCKRTYPRAALHPTSEGSSLFLSRRALKLTGLAPAGAARMVERETSNTPCSTATITRASWQRQEGILRTLDRTLHTRCVSYGISGGSPTLMGNFSVVSPDVARLTA